MSTPVKIHVYDLSKGAARQLSLQLTGKQIDGVWHTSVVVFGKEIFYGQGICQTEPGNSHHGSPLTIIDAGETAIDQQTFEEYLTEIKDHYTADKYHLLDFNCNSFTNDCVGFLTGGSLPSYIKDLPSDFLSTPFGAAMRPTIDAMFRGGTPISVPKPPADNGPTAAALPNAALTSSLLQAVASRAASNGSGAPSFSGNYLPTPALTSPPTLAQSSTLTNPVHIATNPSSFQNVLQTHRAVVAFFTSVTCGPCRMIEPVFEDLAMNKSRVNASIAFVKIDLSVGMSNAVAGEYSVRVTPTFIFFLDGKKTHEMKGVNAPELRTQVDMLIYQAFPPHPHTAISLPAIEAISLNAILFSQVPNLDAVLVKVMGFIDAAPSWSGPSTKEDTKLILAKNVIPYLKARGPSSPANISFEPWRVATKSLVTNISVGELFPIADLWRVALFDPAVCGWSATTLGHERLESPILVLLCKAQGAPRNYILTLLRLVSNAFSNQVLARELLLSSRSSVTALLISALLHEDATVRTAAASLSFNMAAHLQRLRVEKVRGNADVDDAGENEDWEIEMTSALLEAIEREKANEEIVHRLAASLALLVRLSPFLEQLNPLLEVLQARRILKDKLERGGLVKKEVRKLIGEVAEKLCS